VYSLTNYAQEQSIDRLQAFSRWGVKSLYDYSRLRLRVLAKGNKKQMSLDNCTFDLTGVANDSIRLELITNQYELPERHAVVRYLRRDLPVIELGGSMGVVACVTNKLLTDPDGARRR
jgi:hypothetical protein